MRLMLAMAVAAMAASGAAAEEACSSYAGRTITPTTFDALVEAIAKLPPQAPAESPDQYGNRVKIALGASPLLIARAPEDPKHLEYDTATQKVVIKTFAFQNRMVRLLPLLTDTRVKLNDAMNETNNLYVVLSVTQGTSEAATGSRAFPKFVTKMIYERRTGRAFEPLFPQAEKSPYVVGEIAMPPADFETLKPKLKLVFVTVPRAPYYLHGGGLSLVGDTKGTVQELFVLLADIQCGMVVDDKSRVLGSWATN